MWHVALSRFQSNNISHVTLEDTGNDQGTFGDEPYVGVLVKHYMGRGFWPEIVTWASVSAPNDREILLR